MAIIYGDKVGLFQHARTTLTPTVYLGETTKAVARTAAAAVSLPLLSPQRIAARDESSGTTARAAGPGDAAVVVDAAPASTPCCARRRSLPLPAAPSSPALRQLPPARPSP